jgi:hypothetical protein
MTLACLPVLATGHSRAITAKLSTGDNFPPKGQAQPNAPTCLSKTAHASDPYFSFHSV